MEPRFHEVGTDPGLTANPDLACAESCTGPDNGPVPERRSDRFYFGTQDLQETLRSTFGTFYFGKCGAHTFLVHF